MALILLSCLGVFLVPGLTGISPDETGIRSSMDYFRTEAPIFATSCSALHKAISRINGKDPQTLTAARNQLINCRLHYKKIEFFMEYFFRSSSRVYNSAPKYEAEEPDMEYQPPVGLQVIEALLFEKNVGARKKELLQQADAVASSASALPGFLYDFHASDGQLLESLRLELVRIMALGITGYDAPLLKSGISESCEALRSLQYQLRPFLVSGEAPTENLQYWLGKAIFCLEKKISFDRFDRMAFFTEAALPLQRGLGMFIRQKGLELNTNGVLNYSAPDLFSPDALNPESFPAERGAHENKGETGNKQGPGNGGTAERELRPVNKPAMIELGRRLFAENALSGNGSRSCATCHSPEKMFCDQLPSPVAMDGHSHLARNAPSLLYSSYQYEQFWDGRVKTLEEQVRAVLHDTLEMNADYPAMIKRMNALPAYDSLFRRAFGNGAEDSNIARSIAAFLRTLHPMNSPFDRYMGGDKAALSASQINGANLFMGKAQCATCHFIPLFNGLIPPDYARTESEVLGTTATDDLVKPRLSKDVGRYSIYPFSFYKGAFKTPTVRNAALTYPYMHNGAYGSLQKVLEFYNKGGGTGLGLKVPGQTLSSQSLHLNQKEMDDIILFLRGLTDTSSFVNLSVTSNHQL
ncbi:MAG TPA: cytochrome c peroxidase [Puia sp.]|nr:cytochrome c peroxidase [Puia sp.]